MRKSMSYYLFVGLIILTMGACSNSEENEPGLKEEKKGEKSELVEENNVLHEELSEEEDEELTYTEFIISFNIINQFEKLIELKKEIIRGDEELRSDYTIKRLNKIGDTLVKYVDVYENDVYPKLQEGQNKSLFNSFLTELKQSANTSVRAYNNDDVKMLETLTEEHMSLANGHLANWKKEHKIDIVYFEEIKVIQNEVDGEHYWKGQKELINGYDWMALSEKEKFVLIMLCINKLESSTSVITKRNIEEYVEEINDYYQEQVKQNETIKDVKTNILIEEIKN